MPAFGLLAFASALLLEVAAAPPRRAPVSAPAALEMAGSPAEAASRPAPNDPPPPAYRRDPVLGMFVIAPLIPTAFHLRSGGATKSGGGVALLSTTHRGWVLPKHAPVTGFTRFGGSLAITELTYDGSFNGFLVPLDQSITTGARWALGGGHYVYLSGGFDALLRMSPANGAGAQRKRGYLHLPEGNVGVHHQSRGFFWELGPMGGLAVVGHDSLAFGGEVPRAGVGTYGFRPYAGGVASVVTNHLLLSASAQRTWIAGAATKRDERLTGLLCTPLTASRHGDGLGACASTEIAHAVAPGKSALTSYEFTLRVGLFHLGMGLE